MLSIVLIGSKEIEKPPCQATSFKRLEKYLYNNYITTLFDFERVPMIKVGSCIQFKHYSIFPGETIPDIPEEEWTGEVISSWGIVRKYHKVKRHFDNRIIPVMERDIVFSDRVWVDKPKAKKYQKKGRVVTSAELADPLIQTLFE
jgi:hypothetical protein